MRETEERGDAYIALADWFETLNDDCGYEEWSQYLLNTLQSLPLTGNKGLDIGCGSGYFTRALARAGYAVTGVDLSKEMLTKAQSLSAKEGLRIPYIQSDVASLRTAEKYDFAVSVNDCFNYVKKSRFASALKRVHTALKKGGYFLFDISSEEKLKNKVASSVSADDRDDVTYLSFNSLEGDRVTMDVTLFVRQANGLFARFDERHSLYIYTKEEICQELQQAGFSLVATSGHLGGREEGSDRIEFIAKKE